MPRESGEVDEEWILREEAPLGFLGFVYAILVDGKVCRVIRVVEVVVG